MTLKMIDNRKVRKQLMRGDGAKRNVMGRNVNALIDCILTRRTNKNDTLLTCLKMNTAVVCNSVRYITYHLADFINIYSIRKIYSVRRGGVLRHRNAHSMRIRNFGVFRHPHLRCGCLAHFLQLRHNAALYYRNYGKNVKKKKMREMEMQIQCVFNAN